MDVILSSHSISDLINSLKHLIKFKFNCLTENIQKNILVCVENILQYSNNVDTLIINCLRVGLVEEINEIYKRKEIPFEKNKMALPFLAFHTQDEKLVQKLGVVPRDFYFKRVFKQFISSEPFTPLDPDLFKQQTPMAFISSGISVELESILVFYSGVKTNLYFYEEIIMFDYIVSEEIACKVLRFIVNIPYSDNLYELSRSIVMKYSNSYLALIYDVLFYNCNDTVSALAEKWIDIIRTNKVEFFKKYEELVKLFPNLEKYTTRTSRENNKWDIVKKIGNLNFPGYFDVIREMKDKKIPFIKHELYKDIISSSDRWDNYMQVYLWKILCFQKILFGFDLPKMEIDSLEAKEGKLLISSLTHEKQTEQ